MFNDNIIRTPINGTAERVTSQSGCALEESNEQKRDVLLSRLKFIECEISKRGVGEFKTPTHKAYGMEKLNICLEISSLNEKLKRKSTLSKERELHIECVHAVMKEQLSSFQYKNIIKLARERLIDIVASTNHK